MSYFMDGKTLQKLLSAVKNPLSYATLALLLISGLAYYAEQPLVSVVLLAVYTVVILILLLRQDHPAKAETTKSERDETKLHCKWYPNIQAVYPDMSREIENSFKSGGSTTVEVLGLTLYHMWEYLRNYTNDEACKNLTIRFSTILGTASQTECLQGTWPKLSQAYCEAIKHYKEKHEAELARRKIKISTHTYKHIPMVHGIFINNKHLFLSFTSWSEQGVIEGGNNFYCYYSTDTLIGKSHAQVFRSWMDHITKEPFCVSQIQAHKNIKPSGGAELTTPLIR